MDCCLLLSIIISRSEHRLRVAESNARLQTENQKPFLSRWLCKLIINVTKSVGDCLSSTMLVHVTDDVRTTQSVSPIDAATWSLTQSGLAGHSAGRSITGQPRGPMSHPLSAHHARRIAITQLSSSQYPWSDVQL